MIYIYWDKNISILKESMFVDVFLTQWLTGCVAVFNGAWVMPGSLYLNVREILTFLKGILWCCFYGNFSRGDDIFSFDF